jgi:TruD family tRNA pseudouridine synthase
MTENTQSHLEMKKLEQAFLEQESKNNPNLFEQKTFYDNADFLINYGIFLPNKEKLPDGFLKFCPTDFIVEEIDKDGEISTTNYEPIEKTYSIDQDSKTTIFATLVKCGISTTEAIEELTKLLECNATQIQYSGLKDKHAITAQKISIRQVPIDKILNVNSKNLFLKNITFGKGVMEKGNLIGNRFTILLRTDHSNIDQETIENLVKKIEQVKRNGFYNSSFRLT